MRRNYILYICYDDFNIFIADKNLQKKLDPIVEGPKLGKAIKADGILIDTFDKNGLREFIISFKSSISDLRKLHGIKVDNSIFINLSVIIFYNPPQIITLFIKPENGLSHQNEIIFYGKI